MDAGDEEDEDGMGLEIRAEAASVIYAPAAGPTPGDPPSQSGSPSHTTLVPSKLSQTLVPDRLPPQRPDFRSLDPALWRARQPRAVSAMASFRGTPSLSSESLSLTTAPAPGVLHRQQRPSIHAYAAHFPRSSAPPPAKCECDASTLTSIRTRLFLT